MLSLYDTSVVSNLLGKPRGFVCWSGLFHQSELPGLKS